MEPRAPFVIGTAGHIDHGKTVLVRALTGKDTDRLPEEKERGISIDLGFAPFVLPDGTEAAIVDVPGHERFIKNMLAGATGIDLLLLAVAADDGVMPQTLEHLAIADLLDIQAAVVAITKCDLVDEAHRNRTAKAVRESLRGTRFAEASIIEVAAVQGSGIKEVVGEITKAAAKLQRDVRDLPWRLPIDRVFSIDGFGTIVAGTLWSGELTSAQAAEMLPQGWPVRIRSIQVHGRQVGMAKAGQRVAVNLAGIAKDEIRRGDVLASAGFYRPTRRIDVVIRLLAEAEAPIKNNSKIRFHHGTKESIALVRLFQSAFMQPGRESYAQLQLDKPTVVYYGDRFVIRWVSPPGTIGGGRILDSQAKPVRKRDEARRLAEMRILAGGRPKEIVQLILKKLEPAAMTVDEICSAAELPKREVERAVEKLAKEGTLSSIRYKRMDYYILATTLGEVKKAAGFYLAEFHRQNPYLAGARKDQLQRAVLPRLSSSQTDVLLEMLINKSWLKADGDRIRLTTFSLETDEKIKKQMDRVDKLLRENLFSPPTVGDLGRALGIGDEEARSLIGVMQKERRVVILGELVFLAAAVEGAKQIIKAHLLEHGQITVSKWRQLLDTSRKYALPLLEYFDRESLTRREGDVRVLK